MRHAHILNTVEAVQFLYTEGGFHATRLIGENSTYTVGKAAGENSKWILTIQEPRENPVEFYKDVHVLKEGDWLLRDINGRLSTVTHDDFLAEYCQIPS